MCCGTCVNGSACTSCSRCIRKSCAGAVSWTPVGLRAPRLPLANEFRPYMCANGDTDALSAKDAEIERLRKAMEEMQAQLAAKETAVEQAGQALKATQDAAAAAIEEARKTA